MRDYIAVGLRLMWSAYVCAVIGDEAQQEVADAVGVSQATISRWKAGETVPTSHAAVASLALHYGRNPIEAMVAAGMLDVETAGPALRDDDRRHLTAMQTADVFGDTLRNPLYSA